MGSVYHSLVGSWYLDDVKMGKYTSLFDGGHIIYAVIHGLVIQDVRIVQCLVVWYCFGSSVVREIPGHRFAQVDMYDHLQEEALRKKVSRLSKSTAR